MPSAKYTTIALPKDLIALVDEFLETNEWGFRTRPELIAEATREFLFRVREGKKPRRRDTK